MTKTDRKKPNTMTIDQVAKHIIAELTPAQREGLKTSTMPAVGYHRSLGLFIRNKYIYPGTFRIDTSGVIGAWGADGVSNVIVERMLQILRKK
ncbi:MAG: hypothetical protein ACPGTU_12795 [Myxococcota bacterium]